MSQRAIPTTDRISTLPDAVLCHILSFLPTKAAAATCILSKRWIRLWLLVPIFDFDDRSYVQSKETYSRRFNKSVYAAILSRDVHQPIKTFRLKCLSPSHFDDPSDVNIWVNAVLQRRVEHLELFMPCHWLGASSIKLPLPSGILTCRTLVVLKMKLLYVKAFLCVDLPSLKILHLDFVRFLERRYLEELIFGCPILEDLQAKNLEFSNILSGAEFESLPKLVRADISYPDFPLKAINNVKFLRLDKIYWIGIGYRINPCAEDIIPMFQNLAHIELISIDYPIWYEVVEVLKHCPKLQILVIEKKSYDFLPEMENLGEDWPYPQSVPKCILLHLRSCRLNNYKGSKGEFRFAEYIMQNARLLHTMTICSASASNLPEKFKMLKKLCLCRRCSATCQLSFN